MTKFSGEYPYENYWVYAPIFHKKENRNYACLVSKNNPKDKTTISYAKYIMSINIGRLLESNETVDHKDENKLNDSFDNLQILTRKINQTKYINSRVYRTMVDLICPNCNKPFIRDWHHTHLGKPNGVFTSCSRKCSGTIRQKMQMGEEIDLTKNVVKVRKEKTTV